MTKFKKCMEVKKMEVKPEPIFPLNNFFMDGAKKNAIFPQVSTEKNVVSTF